MSKQKIQDVKADAEITKSVSETTSIEKKDIILTWKYNLDKYLKNGCKVLSESDRAVCVLNKDGNIIKIMKA